MKNIKKTFVVLILCSFIMGTIPVSVLAQQNSLDDNIFEHKGPNLPDGVEYVPGELIVEFKPGVSNRVIDNINSKHGTSVMYTSPYAGFKRLHVPKGKSVPDMVEKYKRNPNVEYAEPDYIARASMVPNDYFYDVQWNFDNDGYGGINMEEAWEISSGAGVIVAVLDTGVAYEDYTEDGIVYAQAPDLAGTTFVSGYDFVNNDEHPNDDEGHGTHVTGTIAQTTNNNIGVAGIAYNAYIMPVKVLDSSGSGYYSWIAEGIRYATDNGAEVISMSLGGPRPSRTLQNALSYAYSNGVTIVCSSGNDESDNKISYPAAYDAYCIAVGATRYDEEVTYYSNGGSSLDLTAPGGQIYIEGTYEMLDQNGDGYWDGILQQTHDGIDYTKFGYYFYMGTSMAAPHVSGVAALLISEGVANTPDEVREALESTAEDKGPTGWDSDYGWGIVDASAALQWTATPNNPPVAGEQVLTTDEDTNLAITLTATDIDMDQLIYSIVSGPSNGELTGTPPNVNYIPNPNYNGPDSFSFKANNGISDSNTATVSITVNPVNDAPVADEQSVTTQEGTAVEIVLTGNDVDGDNLIYIIITQPANGNLSGVPPSITYMPDSGYIGDDNFTFKVNDSEENSTPATVSITVTEAKPIMHIASIDVSFTQTKEAGPNIFGYATAVVTIVNETGIPVQDANVSGHWIGATSDSDSDSTNSDGKVSFDSDTAKVQSGAEFAFTVTNVICDGLTWDGV